MNPAKVIERKIDRQHCLEVLPLLRETISQARQSLRRKLKKGTGLRFAILASMSRWTGTLFALFFEP